MKALEGRRNACVWRCIFREYATDSGHRAPQDSCLFACATARHHSKQRVVGEGRDLLGRLHRPLPRDPGPGVTVTRLWMRRCRRMKEYTTCTTTAWSDQHTVVCVPFRSGCSVLFVLNYQCCCVLPELPVDTTSACSRLSLDSGMVLAMSTDPLVDVVSRNHSLRTMGL
jgi:hypothetical protein